MLCNDTVNCKLLKTIFITHAKVILKMTADNLPDITYKLHSKTQTYQLDSNIICTT